MDEFYKVILRNWGALLPDLKATKNIQVIDLTDVSNGRIEMTGKKVEAIPDVIKIEDDDEEEDEKRDFQALDPPTTLEEIDRRLAYLRCLVGAIAS